MENTLTKEVSSKLYSLLAYIIYIDKTKVINYSRDIIFKGMGLLCKGYDYPNGSGSHPSKSRF